MNRSVENPAGFADRLSIGSTARQRSIDLARAHSDSPADASLTAPAPLPEGKNFPLDPRLASLAVPFLIAWSVSCEPAYGGRGGAESPPVPTRPPIVEPTRTPTPRIEIQQLPTNANWTKTWLEKYPWNPKTQEGALDAHLGISMWAKFQSLEKDKMLVMVNGVLILIDVKDTVLFQSRPRNFDPAKSIAEQVRTIPSDQLKAGNPVEIMYKNTANGKPDLTLISQLDG